MVFIAFANISVRRRAGEKITTICGYFFLVCGLIICSIHTFVGNVSLTNVIDYIFMKILCRLGKIFADFFEIILIRVNLTTVKGYFSQLSYSTYLSDYGRKKEMM